MRHVPDSHVVYSPAYVHAHKNVFRFQSMAIPAKEREGRGGVADTPYRRACALARPFARARVRVHLGDVHEHVCAYLRACAFWDPNKKGGGEQQLHHAALT